MAPQKRKFLNPSISVNTIKDKKVKKSKTHVESTNPSTDDRNNHLILNCSDHIELLYSHLVVDATLYWDETDNCNSNEFKKIIIHQENINSCEESNPSTDTDVNNSDCVAVSSVGDENNEHSVDNLKTLQTEESDGLDQNYRNEFKKTIIHQENINTYKESNQSTDVDDSDSLSNQNNFDEHLPLYENVQYESITSEEEENNELDVDNLRTVYSEESDGLNQNDWHAISSVGDENNEHCVDNLKTLQTEESDGLDQNYRNEFKKTIIHQENINSCEESNPSTDTNDDDLDSLLIQNDFDQHLSVYRNVQYGLITSEEEDNNELDVDNLRTVHSEESDGLNQNDWHAISSVGDENNEHCVDNLKTLQTKESDGLDQNYRNEFKKIIIHQENINSCEESNPSTDTDDDDLDSLLNQNNFEEHLPMYGNVQYESINSDKVENNKHSVDNLRTLQTKEIDGLNQNDYLIISSDECKQNVQDVRLVEEKKSIGHISNDFSKESKEKDVVVISLSDSSDEEIYREEDYIDLSNIKYTNYRSDTEYIRNTFPEFSSQLLLDLQSRFHKQKKSSEVLSYNGRKVGLTIDNLEKIFNVRGWFCGDSINCYLNLLCRGRSDTHFSLDSYFIPDYQLKGYKSTLKRTKGVDIFSKKVVFFPIHLAMVHWALIYADMEKQLIYYIDSLIKHQQYNYELVCAPLIDTFIEYLHEEYREKKNQNIKIAWNKKVGLISPTQMNNVDCGAYVCLNAKNLVLNKFPSFSEQDIGVLRIQIIHEILSDQMIN